MTASVPEPARRSAWESRAPFAAALSLLVLLGLAAEFRSLARADTGFLLDAAGRVLDGGVLYRDVVEINPPLIIALNLVAVQVSRLLGVSDILVYRVGFSLALLGCLWLSAVLLGRVLPREDGRFRDRLILLLALVLFPLPGHDFGEREHLVLALLLPYLILLAGRAMGRDPSRLQAAAIGLLAAVAFALKPHFILVWPFGEVALRLWSRDHRRKTLPEFWSIAVLLGLYLAVILLLTPQYLDLVALLAGPYTRFLYDPFWRLLLTGPGAALIYLGLLAAVALGRRAGHPELWLVIAVAGAACFIAGAAQQKGLEYHFYPSAALATVLLGLVTTDLRGATSGPAERLYRVVASAALLTAVADTVARSAVAVTGYDPGRAEFEERVRVVREHAAGGRVFVMSYHIGSAYPLLNYTRAPSASRFPQLWILPASYLDQLHADRPLRFHTPAEMDLAERYLNQAVLADLERYRPTVLVVLRHARDLPVNGLRRLDYIAYFSRNPGIAGVLRQYQWVTDAGEYGIYERVPEGAARSGPPPTAAIGTHDLLGTDTEGFHLRLLSPDFLLKLAVFLIALAAFGRATRPREEP